MIIFSTPILFIIYNRPATTKRVFEEIRKQKPKYLFIAADGPKEHQLDKKLCDEARLISTQIDWDCELKTLFREKNLGCKYAVSSAISWFFQNVEAGIILEDDCLPNASFFDFCAHLLNKYEKDENIMHITGCNLDDRMQYGDGSYYFSKYAHIWGWATWRRAWSKYDLELVEASIYPRVIDTTFQHYSEREFWKSRIKLIQDNLLDTWDYQWLLSIWREKGMSLNSNANFIENIGFGSTATHTTGKSNYITGSRRSENIIKHPSSKNIIAEAEKNFLLLVHCTHQQSYWEYVLRIFFLQRLYNLFDKIRQTATRV